MKKYKTLSIIFIIIFLSGFFWNLLKPCESLDLKKEIEACKIVLPEAENFSKKTGNPLHYKAFKFNNKTQKEDLIGLAFLTTDISPEISGYAGPIKVMVGIDIKGTINKIHIISHTETPSYMTTLNKFTAQFKSLDIKSKFKVGKDIDAISRATITSEAITRAVEKSFKSISKNILHLKITDTLDQKTSLDPNQISLPIILFIIASLAAILVNRGLRWIALAAGFIYFGLVKNTMLSIIHIANIGLLKIPKFNNAPILYILLILTGITCLLFGRIYCGNICPFGGLQEIIYKIFNIFRSKKFILTKKIDQHSKYLKYIIVFLTLIVSFILGNSNPAAIEPFLTFFKTNTSKLGFTFLTVVLIASSFYFRFWCVYLCPIGALTGLLSKISLFKIKLNDKCKGCKTCKEICPTNAIHLDKNQRPIIESSECIICNKCIKKCSEKALYWGKNKNEKTR